MSMYFCSSTGTRARRVKIYRNPETDEFICRLFINNVERVEARYFTPSREDAEGTARLMAKEPE